MTVEEFLKCSENPYEAVLVHEGSTIVEVLDAMLDTGEERMVCVVDEQKRLRGVITTGSLARHLFHQGISPEHGFTPSSSILHYLTAEHAGDIMERDVVCCALHEPLEEAVARMFGRDVVKMLPVVDTQMRVVDVLSVIAIMEARLRGNAAV